MKKANLSWDYLGIIVILLILLVVLVLFSKTLKEQALEGIQKVLSLFEVGG